ncbi:MAG: type II toxin-antitoxin system RelE/ParE family toxin [Pseudoramibacter sp.]|jgi:plasmid stabilization system protein ParE
MVYKLIIPEHTAHQIDQSIGYIVETLKNPSAAQAVMEDIEYAYNQLKKTAASFAFCEDPYLRAKGYRKLVLQHHDYVLIYRVEKETVYLAGFFHTLENYIVKL